MGSTTPTLRNRIAFSENAAQNDRAKTAFVFDCSDLVSFLVAGAALFGSLAVGSSVSLVLVGGNALVGTLLANFLELGLWATAGFLVLAAIAFAAFPSRHR